MIEAKTLDEYIQRAQVDGVMWKAHKLLGELPATDIRRNDNVIQIAQTLALIPMPVLRDDYAKKICKEHNIVYKTLEKLISDALIIHRKKDEQRKTVRKNKIQKLEGDPRKFPFFHEKVKQDKDGSVSLDKVKIDKYKFVQLLSNFGFTRYETGADDKNRDGYTFVRLNDSVISSVTRDQIIDHIEKFVKTEYDFEGAGYEYVDAETLINTFYDQIRTVFSKDLFARVRTEEPIIINKDKKDKTFLYYQNGFAEITKDGWGMKSYSEMDGSVWDHQMLSRKFTPIDWADPHIEEMGYFADFTWRIANEDPQRWKALVCIIGYLIHDFYEYKLKAILFTDSSISEASEGRTGKTLLAKMIGQVRSYTEINGKDFDTASIAKYQDANLGTQVLHLNDVKHRGRFRFDFEDVFNDITEGYIVKKLYMPTFRQYSKMIISSNKTLNIQGASQRDRIVEFEMSPFFGEHQSPADFYGHWFGRDWDETEYNRFDNFMCFCAMYFHKFGLIEPSTINLGERKLLNHTAPEFIEFMDDITETLKRIGVPWESYNGPALPATFAGVELKDFPFDKAKLHEKFLGDYPDFKKYHHGQPLHQRSFNRWLHQFADLRLGVKNPREWKSNGANLIQFVPNDK